MDAQKIRSALLSQLNDEISVIGYGHGQLVTLPFAYYDGDLVTVFVEPFEGGLRVTDQGATALRLQMADVDLGNAKVAEGWKRSVAGLGEKALAAEEAVVAAWGAQEQVGDLVQEVAQASLRIDQLRWLAHQTRPVRFRDQVVARLTSVAGTHDRVLPNALLRQQSGRQRSVTAVVERAQRSVYVQALSGKDRDAAAEHCFYIFSHAALAPGQRLAIAAGRRGDWSAELLDELSAVTDVAFFDQDDDVRAKLSGRFALQG